MNSRRTFLYQTAAAAALVSAPWVARSQGAAPIKVGVLHPVTGALAYSGQQCRLGALLAIEDINKAGGIKSLGGAPLQAVLCPQRAAADRRYAVLHGRLPHPADGQHRNFRAAQQGR